MKPITSYTRVLEPAQAKALNGMLKRKGYRPHEVPHASFAWKGEDVNVVFYKSKKLVVQGKGTQDFVQFLLEPEILKKAELGYEAELNPDLLLPRLGIDESGKGDFFGPMCIAGVYLNEQSVKVLMEAGVKDSKAIGTDRRIAALAEVIEKAPGVVCEVVKIGNAAYNRLFTKMKSVNRILAWGHARAIENLMRRSGLMKPPPVRAISDQFARSKSTVAGALMHFGRGIELIQRHKAESDLAVAAASILARHSFVSALKQFEKQYGMEFPKGASDRVIEAGREFVEKHGESALSEVSKVHFKTSKKVLAVV